MKINQIIFVAILIIIVNCIAIYTCLRVEDWQAKPSAHPLNDSIASMTLILSIIADSVCLLLGLVYLYDWLGSE